MRPAASVVTSSGGGGGGVTSGGGDGAHHHRAPNLERRRARRLPGSPTDTMTHTGAGAHHHRRRDAVESLHTAAQVGGSFASVTSGLQGGLTQGGSLLDHFQQDASVPGWVVQELAQALRNPSPIDIDIDIDRRSAAAASSPLRQDEVQRRAAATAAVRSLGPEPVELPV
jgi:hypothetical protein